jgi:hypothetical protein
VASSDHDLIGDGSGSTGLGAAGSGDQVGTSAAPIDPGLGPLQNNGGPTSTMALLPGSPAIDAGSNAFVAPLPAPTGLRVTVQGPPIVQGVFSTPFVYRVTAFNLAGESLASTVVSATTFDGIRIPGQNSVTLSWNAVPGATGYKVYGRTGGLELFLGTSPAVASPSFTDTGRITPGSLLAPPSPVTITDQRGFARISGPSVDIGAFEFQDPALSTPSLPAGTSLQANQSLSSPNGQYQLLMQTDGNLVEYGPGRQVIWNAMTDGNPGAYATMQSDGNFVVYSAAGTALWNAGTSGNPGAFLFLEGVGTLEIIYQGRVIWSV